MSSSGPIRLPPFTKRSLRRVALFAAVIGSALGVETLLLHLTTDPLGDVRLYYDAGARLNSGLPLYVDSSSPGVGPYINPPLLALMFRPLALLPFPVAAAIWQTIVVAAFVLTLRRVGIREPVLIALGCLALPTLWALSVGQAEVIITLMLSIGTPASVAIAGHLKLIPWLAAVYWVGRCDRRSLVRLLTWILIISAAQLALEPAGTVSYLRLEWLKTAFDYRSISPFAIHPLLWLAVVLVAAALAVRFAPTRLGWPLAVALAVLAYPRLLVYQLMSLLAVFGGPRAADPGHAAPDRD